MHYFLRYGVQPHILLYWIMTISMVIHIRRHGMNGWPTKLLIISFLTLSLVSSPATIYLALASLEWGYPPRADCPQSIEAIVVLGTEILPKNGVRPEPQIDSPGLYRCLEVLRMNRSGPPVPILVVGGRPPTQISGPACAPLMKDFLIQRGIRPDRITVDSLSKNTRENAIQGAKFLRKWKANRILLITDSIHLHRATGCFEKLGFQVTPAGSFYRCTRFEWSLYFFLPDLAQLSIFKLVAHEWIGNFWYWTRDWI